MSEPCRFLLEPLPLTATFGEVQEARRDHPARYEDYITRMLDASIQAGIQQDYQEDWYENEWLGGVYR